MTKKFTEEEYQKIVEIADLYFEQHKSEAVIVNLKNIYDYIFYNETVESEKIKDLNQELLLIALPKYRDWAHDQFVEKEKKYYWKTKKTDRHGKPRRLAKDEDGAIYFIGRVMKLGHTSKITETELREWGYIPDMFDREEVE